MAEKVTRYNSSSTSLFKKAKIKNIAEIKKEQKLILLEWCRWKIQKYNLTVTDFKSSWTNGLAFCALFHNYIPNLFNFKDLDSKDIIKNLKTAELIAKYYNKVFHKSITV
jgi:hypothetical protein